MASATPQLAFHSSRKPSSTSEPNSYVSPVSTREARMEELAFELLNEHPHFKGRGYSVVIRCESNRLLLGGCLPTYYLKQLAQEAVRKIEGVQIVNQISVTGMIAEIVPPQVASLDPIKKPR